MRPPEPGLTEETIVARSRDLIPVLRKRAVQAERARELPRESIQDFIDAGFYRILQPRRFGGYEFGLRTFCDVMINISRGCGSSGWVLCLTGAHAFHMAAFPEEGQIEMYGDDGDFRSPLIFAPQGTATPIDGGYRLDGRWNYNSGGEHANWLALSAIVDAEREEGEPPDLILGFVRREDYEIFDNWHVMGMRATGSKQAIVSGAFVPERRVIHQAPWLAGEAPGFGVHENPFYRTPPMEVFCAELSSICVGLGEAAIDAFHERAMTKPIPFAPFGDLKAERSTQRRMGQARAKIDAASAVLDRMVANQLVNAEKARLGSLTFEDEGRRRGFMLAQQVAILVREAIDVLFEASGTSATQAGEAMERIYRDMAMIRTHYIMDHDRTAENWGASAFGLEAYSPN
jgi:3-hydroxy-9,10-secoandrosta-1,3,5(10)-triene-9,17-dione monooxygenase